MRHLASVSCALALVAIGCNGEGLPNGVNSPGGPTGSGGANGGGGGSGASDLGSGALVDLAQPPGGPAGSPCKTACDCEAGLACRQSRCSMSMFGPIYCCSSPSCPNGNFCETQAGQFRMCGGGGGGGPGGGGGGGGFGPPDGGFCQFLPCMSNDRCKMAGCGTCDQSLHRCQQ